MQANKQPQAKPQQTWNALFDPAQLPVPKREKRARSKQSNVGRRLAPVVGGVQETSINPLFTAPMGKVRLEGLTDPDWKKQLSAILHTYGRIRSNDFSAKTSEETLRNRMDILFSTMIPIMKERKLRSLSQVKPRLLPRMFELWTEKGVSKRAQINYFNVMRWYWRVFGIQLDPIATYAKEKDEFTINRNATHDKSWAGNDVDFLEIYEKMYAMDPVAARLLVAMKTFGLRLKESLRLQPHEVDGGNSLLLTKGTKTGRARQLEFEVFDEDDFRGVLDELKDEVAPECHLAWSNRNLAQAKDRMRYLAKKLGLTKKQLGVTYHGLRTDFAIDWLKKLAGAEAPVRGGLALNYKELSAVRHKIMDALGHHRLEITGAYYGSFLSMERQQLRAFTRSWERIEAAMNEVGLMLMGSGVQNLYWIGARALGAISSQEPYEFVFPPETDDAVVLRLSAQICELVLGATGTDCMVHNWKSLPGAKQTLWEAEAIPVFKSVSPLDCMTARMKEQKLARMQVSTSENGAAF